MTKREKRVCKKCEVGGVVAAPAPPRTIEKSLASERVILDTVVAKYRDHVPLYRQSAILERETGIEIHQRGRLFPRRPLQSPGVALGGFCGLPYAPAA